MKGLILSGGSGTRLRPITHTSAKQLVPIANKPILFYVIEDMVESGISDIGIIVGQTSEEIMAAVGDGSSFGAKITYIHQVSPLGLAHCVQVAASFLGNSNFVMYLGDNMVQNGLVDFIKDFDDSTAAKILLKEVDNPSSFGVADIDEDGKITKLVEKPEIPTSNLALVGVYLFTPKIHDAVGSIRASKRGELEITDAIQWLIDNNEKVSHSVLDGWWIDTGKKDPLLECNRLVLDTIERKIHKNELNSFDADGRVEIGDAIIIDSKIIGPCIIADGALIENSYIGPYTSVGEGCIVKDSEIQNSVLMAGSRVVGIPRISDSLIGKNAVIKESNKKPAAIKLMISDDSIVEIS